jgi:hypothetical protein
MPFNVTMNRRLTSLVEGLRKLLPGSSLIREAKREQMRVGGIIRSERIVAWTRAKVRAALGTPVHDSSSLTNKRKLPSGRLRFFETRNNVSTR